MKFKTAHKNFQINESGGKKKTYRAHRNGTEVWVTSGDKGVTIMKHVYKYVSQAKNWMNNPSLNN